MGATRQVSQELRGSIDREGRRSAIHPADVRGRLTRVRQIGFAVLLAVYVALPWIPLGGHPAVFLDLEHRRFHLFGAAFNAQDTWLLFFLLAGAGLLLITATALFGRVWCGYACPQTVFLDGVFRRIERWIDGPAAARRRHARGPGALARAALKHGLYAALSLGVAHVFLSYFVSLPHLFAMMQASPAEHPAAFGWVAGLSALMYGNFAWFREQTCLIVCPYGRLQSALTDADTIIIGYDATRGEPRGKLRQAGAGDCLDCGRCVAVCPTGIDIRNGHQIECIGCAACVDACDEIMRRVGRAPGLVRYDSARSLAGEPRRRWRPRMLLYAALGLLLAGGAALALGSHRSFEANLLRAPGMPFVLAGDRVRNSFELHLVNKDSSRAHFSIAPVDPPPEATVTVAERELDLDAGESTGIAVFAEIARERHRAGMSLRLHVTRDDGKEQEHSAVESRLLGPAR